MNWLRRRRPEQDLERELRADLELEAAEQEERERNGLHTSINETANAEKVPGSLV